jgi:hypothetical protein
VGWAWACGRSFFAGQRIKLLSKFFTQLVNVIPPAFYMEPRDEDEEDPVRT